MYDKVIIFPFSDAEEIASPTSATITDAYIDQIDQLVKTTSDIYIIMFLFFGFWFIFKLKSILHRLLYNSTRSIDK